MTRGFLLSNLIQSGQEEGLKWRFNLDAIACNMHTLKDFPMLDTSFNGPVIFIGGERSDYIK